MTTTIVPSAGAAPLYTQQGTGTTPGYSALDDRRANIGPTQEGIYGTPTLVTAGGVANVANADFMVTQRNAGANLSVDINMPAGGFALVQGDTISGQGLYCVPVHASNINEVLAAADPTNPRIDQVVLEILDNVIDASGNNLARIRVLPGTPTPGATVTNRSGAAALPGSCLLLADVPVAAGASSVANSAIRDRRKWCRGAFQAIIGSNAGSITTASTTATAIVQTVTRLECSGVPLRVSMQGIASNNTAGDGVLFPVLVDSAGLGLGAQQVISGNANEQDSFALEVTFSPAGGSHVLAVGIATVAGGTGSLFNASGLNFVVTYEEILRQTTGNNTVTSG